MYPAVNLGVLGFLLFRVITCVVLINDFSLSGI